MFTALKASFNDYAFKPNCEAGFIGFRYTTDIMTNIVEPWRECALRKECIAPEGTDTKKIIFFFIILMIVFGVFFQVLLVQIIAKINR